MPFRQPRAEYRSLFDKLLKLPDETLVYPAHDYCVELMRGLKLANPKLMDVAVPANLVCGAA